jgi:hypothetical protein
MEMMKTLIDNNIEPTAVLSSWGDAQKHVKDIVNGKTLPLYNGETGADRSVGKAINDKRHHDKLRKHHADILAGHLEPSRLEAPVVFRCLPVQSERLAHGPRRPQPFDIRKLKPFANLACA